MRKITKATFKSFIKHNRPELLFKQNSNFDGMVDGVRQNKDASFAPAVASSHPGDQVYLEHDLGIRGLWLVGQSRDYFTPFETDDYTGIEYTNCCGSGIVAIRRTS